MVDRTRDDGARSSKTLVLGIGNLLLGDEGFGIHAVRRLRDEGLPDGVDLEDGGTGGVDLLDRMAGYGRVVLIDAIRVGRDSAPVSAEAGFGDRGSRAVGGAASEGDRPRAPAPGDVVVFRLNTVELENPDPRFSLHETSLGGLLRLAASLRIQLPEIDVVGFVPAAIAWSDALSPLGSAAIEVALARVRELLAGRV
ncbi:MAG: hydrogenase maturation protease [Candidatus Eisenbacteria bacterium]|nr:hydrogenase maturation protease [Candidatus Eisenbacteria bacterium]